MPVLGGGVRPGRSVPRERGRQGLPLAEERRDHSYSLAIACNTKKKQQVV